MQTHALEFHFLIFERPLFQAFATFTSPSEGPFISCCAYASIIMHFNLVHVLTLYNLNHSLPPPMEIGLFVNIYIGLVPIQATSPYLSWSILTNQLPKHLNDIFNLIYFICRINPLLWFAFMIFMFNMTIRIMFNSIVGAHGWTWTPNQAFVPKNSFNCDLQYINLVVVYCFHILYDYVMVAMDVWVNLSKTHSWLVTPCSAKVYFNQ